MKRLISKENVEYWIKHGNNLKPDWLNRVLVSYDKEGLIYIKDGEDYFTVHGFEEVETLTDRQLQIEELKAKEQQNYVNYSNEIRSFKEAIACQSNLIIDLKNKINEQKIIIIRYLERKDE